MVKASYSTRLALITILAMPFLLGAEVYKWVDEDGVVHFSQLPQRNTAAERINVRSGTSSHRAVQPTTSKEPTASTEAQPLTPEQQAMQDQLNKEEQSRMQNIAKARDDNCKAAQKRFDNLTQYARIRMKGADGEYRVLTEEERMKEINQAKADVVEFCSGS